MKNLRYLLLLAIGICAFEMNAYSQRYLMNADVVCTKSQDLVGDDEIYLLIEHLNGTTTKTPKHEIRETEKLNMGKAIEVMDGDLVKVYEYDAADADDLLLTLKIQSNQGDGKNYYQNSDPDASFNYTIFYSLTPVEVNIKLDEGVEEK